MIEITRQFTGLAKHITAIGDVVDVLQWAVDRPGLYCTVSARTDGTWLIEVGGVDIPSVYVEVGQWVVFDGEQFSALTPEQFAEKGYATS